MWATILNSIRALGPVFSKENNSIVRKDIWKTWVYKWKNISIKQQYNILLIQRPSEKQF